MRGLSIGLKGFPDIDSSSWLGLQRRLPHQIPAPRLVWTSGKTLPATDRMAVMLNAPRRRVTFIDHTAMLGGAEVSLCNLVALLDRARWQPSAGLGAAGPRAH